MPVFYPKSLERVVRDLLKSRCEQEYIRHYMMEEYKIGEDVMDAIFTALGVADPGKSKREIKIEKRKERMKGFTKF